MNFIRMKKDLKTFLSSYIIEYNKSRPE
uniref:Uncharacterized protein n=1 Tax=Arundo donax TaxID=35708 RepID=A0A0A9GRX9_ARUDO